MTERELMVELQGLDRKLREIRSDIGESEELHRLYDNMLWSLKDELEAIIDDLKLNGA